MSEPDLSEFKALSQRKRQLQPCKIGVALERLDTRKRTLLEAALAAPETEVSPGGIVKWLEIHGQDIRSHNSVIAHRKERCACYGG